MVIFFKFKKERTQSHRVLYYMFQHLVSFALTKALPGGEVNLRYLLEPLFPNIPPIPLH